MSTKATVAITLSLSFLGLGWAGLAVAQDPEEEEDVSATGATSTVTFYPHIFDFGSDGPMPGNTQYPWGNEDLSAGAPGNGCGLDPTGLARAPCEQWANNVLYVYSTAGFVEVHTRWDFAGDYSRFHNERGQAKDIYLDRSKDVTATFYMSADWHPWTLLLCDQIPPRGVPMPTPCWNWDPGAYPDWQVDATLFIGSMGEYQGQASEAPPVHAKVVSGDVKVVAQGASPAITMVSLDSNLPGGRGEVYQFDINLGKPQVEIIPKESDWIMRYRWWINNGVAGKLLLPQINWNLNTGEFYPTRFTLPIRNAFDVELVYPQFLHDKLLVHAIMNSPWGSYDVNPGSVRLTIADAQGVPQDLSGLTQLSDYSVAHGGHYKPVNVTWIWDYHTANLRPGVYTATVDACNWQGSACSTVASVFRLDGKGVGSTVQIGRSGIQTFTSDQLSRIEQAAAAAAGAESLVPTGRDEIVTVGGGGDSNSTPGLEAAALAAALGVLALVRRRRIA
ncbi:MAG TPA: hypothetical protein VM681_07385 [Candidatus Thermoplasmatota archaeon]|nr:hypothetical protein [Candidatus Thermoplasmatota archaeon]